MFQVITESWKEVFTASLRDDLSFSSLKRVHNTVGGGRLSHYQLDTAAVDDHSTADHDLCHDHEVEQVLLGQDWEGGRVLAGSGAT
jgi:hypothetical protein